MSDYTLTAEDLQLINSRKGLKELLKSKNFDLKKTLEKLRYEEELI
jgi:hypothetical protein